MTKKQKLALLLVALGLGCYALSTDLATISSKLAALLLGALMLGTGLYHLTSSKA